MQVNYERHKQQGDKVLYKSRKDSNSKSWSTAADLYFHV